MARFWFIADHRLRTSGRWLVACLLVLGAASVRAEERALPTEGILYTRRNNNVWQVWLQSLAGGLPVQVSQSSGDKRLPMVAPDGSVAYCSDNFVCRQSGGNSRWDEPLLRAFWPVRDIAWSPDGTALAFSRVSTEALESANLWLSDAHGGNARQITYQAGIQEQAAWSPTGQWIAYAAKIGKKHAIHVIRSDGEDRRQLTNGTSDDVLPAWSPDGVRIAYSSDRGGNADIWIMNADGSGARPLAQSSGSDTRPAWSPDGRGILFATNRSGRFEIWVMNADGSNQRLRIQDEEEVMDPLWFKR